MSSSQIQAEDNMDADFSNFKTYTSTHTVQLFDSGGPLLGKIMEMIDNAKESIDLEFWAVEFCGDAGQLILQKLYKKIEESKKSGHPIKVNLLVDHYLISKGPPFSIKWFAKEFEKNGIELRIFNPVADKHLGGSYLTASQRDHRKQIVIDDKEFIIGGTNLYDDYFGVAQNINRIDKAIWVKGDAAKSAGDSFKSAWDSNLTVAPSKLNAEYAKKTPSKNYTSLADLNRQYSAKEEEASGPGKGYEYYPGCMIPKDKLPDEINIIPKEVEKHNKRQPPVTVRQLSIGLDTPGTKMKNSTFVPALMQKMKQAKKNVLIENEYFIPTGATKDALKTLKKNKVKVKIITNSQESDDGDSEGVLVLSHEAAYNWDDASDNNFQVYGYNGKTPKGEQIDWAPRGSGTKWSVHSKAMVIDDDTVWIGSNNLDPRSDYHNIEGGVYIPSSPELALQLKTSIESNNANLIRMATDKKYQKCVEQFREQNGPLIKTLTDMQYTVFKYFY